MAGEQFGAMAVNLAGAEADTSAMQIEGLAKAGGQGLGQAVDGYNQADFNRAIEDGEAYLNQMADELDIPPEKRNMIKFFSGNEESVKAGAKFLMDSTEQQRRDTGINNMLGLGQGINEKYKGLSADRLNVEGLTPEDQDAIREELIAGKTDEMKGLRLNSKDKYDLDGYDKVFGGGNDTDDWKRYMDSENLKVAKERIGVSKHSNVIKDKKETRQGEQFSVKMASDAYKTAGIGGAQGMRAMTVQSGKLGRAINKAVIETEDGETPGFVPFGSFDALPDWAKKSLNEAGIGDVKYTQKANQFRASIGQYLDRYKKFISGTAVSDQEYNKLMFNMSAGTFSTFPEFLWAFKEMVNADALTYNGLYDDANKIYSASVGGVGALEERGIGNPGAEMADLYSTLDGLYAKVEGYKDVKFDGAAFKANQKLSEITAEEKANARAETDAANDKAMRDNSNSFTLNELGVKEVTTGGVTSSTKPTLKLPQPVAPSGGLQGSKKGR